MTANDYISAVITGYGDILAYCFPVAMIIAACNIAINIIVTAFCGGGLVIGRGRGK